MLPLSPQSFSTPPSKRSTSPWYRMLNASRLDCGTPPSASSACFPVLLPVIFLAILQAAQTYLMKRAADATNPNGVALFFCFTTCYTLTLLFGVAWKLFRGVVTWREVIHPTVPPWRYLVCGALDAIACLFLFVALSQVSGVVLVLLLQPMLPLSVLLRRQAQGRSACRGRPLRSLRFWGALLIGFGVSSMLCASLLVRWLGPSDAHLTLLLGQRTNVVLWAELAVLVSSLPTALHVVMRQLFVSSAQGFLPDRVATAHTPLLGARGGRRGGSPPPTYTTGMGTRGEREGGSDPTLAGKVVARMRVEGAWDGQRGREDMHVTSAPVEPCELVHSSPHTPSNNANNLQIHQASGWYAHNHHQQQQPQHQQQHPGAYASSVPDFDTFPRSHVPPHARSITPSRTQSRAQSGTQSRVHSANSLTKTLLDSVGTRSRTESDLRGSGFGSDPDLASSPWQHHAVSDRQYNSRPVSSPHSNRHSNIPSTHSNSTSQAEDSELGLTAEFEHLQRLQEAREPPPQGRDGRRLSFTDNMEPLLKHKADVLSRKQGHLAARVDSFDVPVWTITCDDKPAIRSSWLALCRLLCCVPFGFLALFLQPSLVSIESFSQGLWCCAGYESVGYGATSTLASHPFSTGVIGVERLAIHRRTAGLSMFGSADAQAALSHTPTGEALAVDSSLDDVLPKTMVLATSTATARRTLGHTSGHIPEHLVRNATESCAAVPLQIVLLVILALLVPSVLGCIQTTRGWDTRCPGLCPRRLAFLLSLPLAFLAFCIPLPLSDRETPGLLHFVCLVVVFVGLAMFLRRRKLGSAGGSRASLSPQSLGTASPVHPGFRDSLFELSFDQWSDENEGESGRGDSVVGSVPVDAPEWNVDELDMDLLCVNDNGGRVGARRERRRPQTQRSRSDRRGGRFR